MYLVVWLFLSDMVAVWCATNIMGYCSQADIKGSKSAGTILATLGSWEPVLLLFVMAEDWCPTASFVLRTLWESSSYFWPQCCSRPINCNEWNCVVFAVNPKMVMRSCCTYLQQWVKVRGEDGCCRIYTYVVNQLPIQWVQKAYAKPVQVLQCCMVIPLSSGLDGDTFIIWSRLDLDHVVLLGPSMDKLLVWHTCSEQQHVLCVGKGDIVSPTEP